MMKALQDILDGYGLGISKEQLVKKVYSRLSLDGHECYILNERYIGVDGVEYQFIKSRKECRWIAKEF
jgi:hypothetical protein